MILDHYAEAHIESNLPVDIIFKSLIFEVYDMT